MIRKTKRSVSMDKITTYKGAALAALFAFWGGPAVAGPGFQTPSGNIVCYVQGWETPVLNCLIFEADWEAREHSEPGCDLDETRMISLSVSDPTVSDWACHGDVFWPLPLPVLSYGSGWSLAGFDCDVATDGVYCTAPSGHGFDIARRALDLR